MILGRRFKLCKDGRNRRIDKPTAHPGRCIGYRAALPFIGQSGARSAGPAAADFLLYVPQNGPGRKD